MSKRLSSGPDSDVFALSDCRGSYAPLAFVTPSTLARVDSVVTCATTAAAAESSEQKKISSYGYEGCLQAPQSHAVLQWEACITVGM